MPTRRRGGPVVFMAVWLVVWGSAMIVVLWLMAAAAWRGEVTTALFLGLWLAFAAFGLHAGVRRLQTRMGLVAPPDPPAPRRSHGWSDDMPKRPDA